MIAPNIRDENVNDIYNLVTGSEETVTGVICTQTVTLGYVADRDRQCCGHGYTLINYIFMIYILPGLSSSFFTHSSSLFSDDPEEESVSEEADEEDLSDCFSSSSELSIIFYCS